MWKTRKKGIQHRKKKFNRLNLKIFLLTENRQNHIKKNYQNYKSLFFSQIHVFNSFTWPYSYKWNFSFVGYFFYQSSHEQELLELFKFDTIFNLIFIYFKRVRSFIYSEIILKFKVLMKSRNVKDIFFNIKYIIFI